MICVESIGIESIRPINFLDWPYPTRLMRRIRAPVLVLFASKRAGTALPLLAAVRQPVAGRQRRFEDVLSRMTVETTAIGEKAHGQDHAHAALALRPSRDEPNRSNVTSTIMSA